MWAMKREIRYEVAFVTDLALSNADLITLFENQTLSSSYRTPRLQTTIYYMRHVTNFTYLFAYFVLLYTYSTQLFIMHWKKLHACISGNETIGHETITVL